MYELKVDRLRKRFGRRTVFTDISFALRTGQAIAFVGPNGSGKSTLVMTILGYHHAAAGNVSFLSDGQPLDESQVRASASLVSPYLSLYDQLTAEENLKFFGTVSGGQVTGRRINDLLELVGLSGRGDDLVGAYSSGMKQRLKYAVALLGEPDFLFLDEPTSNLDDSGKEIVRQVIDDYRRKSIVIIATNEREEQQFAESICRLGE
ncbi:MAG: ABC transporter ATP-binding protein [candidate division Zixibacteria bacterium]|nr:ABC transporter ATP-binding protein [candidate division Zixibacteria bacterium]